jgi:hypothetical protein
MFDNLRDDSSSTFSEESEAKYQPAAGYSTGRAGSKRFLGMTSIQRFVITFLLMLTVCVLGSMVLLVLGKVAL